MSLAEIVRTTGGHHWANGTRATIPAPGHSRDDNSVSLRLVDDRVLIHTFGNSDWRLVSDQLFRLNLITKDRFLKGGGARACTLKPTNRDAAKVVADILKLCGPVKGTLSATYLNRYRAIEREAASIRSIHHVVRLPVSSYEPNPKWFKPALIAEITDTAGEVHALEITYLNNAGRRDDAIRLPRKMIGNLPRGYMVRLDAFDDTMVVGEGMPTTLSAGDYFSLPSLALLSSSNLGNWTPPDQVRSIIIAADRGPAGEQQAEKLHTRLQVLGRRSRIEFAPNNHKDFNDYAQFQAKCRNQPVPAQA